MWSTSMFALEGVARFPEAAGLVLESGIAGVFERLLLRGRPPRSGSRRPPSRRRWAGASSSGARSPATAGRCWSSTPSTTARSRSHGEQLAAWAGGPATLRTFARGDHNSILAANQEECPEALRAFLAGLGAPRDGSGPGPSPGEIPGS